MTVLLFDQSGTETKSAKFVVRRTRSLRSRLVSKQYTAAIETNRIVEYSSLIIAKIYQI